MGPALIGLLAASGGLVASNGGPCTASLCQPQALAGFAAQLANPPADRPLHILQIGDSHTAGDAITSAWRENWQARLGNGGRGMLPPGHPFKGFRARGLAITTSPGWTLKGIFGAVAAEPRPPIGLSGYTLLSTSAGATLDMVADADNAFDTLLLCAVAGPRGGRIGVTIGTHSETIDLAAATDTPRCERFAAPERAATARLLVMPASV
jgi:hypothetical protein